MLKRTLAVGLTAAAALAAGCGDESTGGGGDGDSGGGDTFVLGVANGQTGYLAPFDAGVLAGVKQGIAEANAKGGLGGKYEIELETADTRSDIGLQATKTQELVDAGADAVVLACDSDPSISGGQVAERAGLPAFGCPSNPGKVGDSLLSLQYSERATPVVTADWAYGQGKRKVFLLGSSELAYTEAMPRYFEQKFEDAGGKVVGEAEYSFEQQDYSKITRDIVDSGADLIFAAMFEPGISTFLRQLRGKGSDVTVLSDGAVDTASVASAGKLEPVAGGSWAFTEGDPAAAMLAKVRKRDGADAASSYAVLGYDLIRVLDAAVREADGIDHAELLRAIRGLRDVEGLVSPISYDWPGADGTQLREVFVIETGGGERSLVESALPDPAAYPPLH